MPRLDLDVGRSLDREAGDRSSFGKNKKITNKSSRPSIVMPNGEYKLVATYGKPLDKVLCGIDAPRGVGATEWYGRPFPADDRVGFVALILVFFFQT
ncbi:MAG: hypothetical protein HC849_17995 [Oscillatoriales cyanobacterium RU_3_3]|nr:hypothetical protein [Microcoleus sp. SU_5_6]NJM61656.1 hypothetical protein [Oscillatoriales cyanobacterium RU_3_3]NJR22886.1 hypothetical protein [Richelia sp. CSU_2_1]